ncbi:hypothetical protein KIN20_001446 [Parelaphostrongylus tenuis]|uniref:Uncharacterized protein n=1 Tax=Parelaphostrongylus tenuis TaxID=148309 RepID=A0AAD5MCK0_PARTN|nr:hypothetical protein KIN20_001446 [Parelaphostrongylus tenuis]
MIRSFHSDFRCATSCGRMMMQRLSRFHFSLHSVFEGSIMSCRGGSKCGGTGLPVDSTSRGTATAEYWFRHFSVHIRQIISQIIFTEEQRVKLSTLSIPGRSAVHSSSQQMHIWHIQWLPLACRCIKSFFLSLQTLLITIRRSRRNRRLGEP